MPGNPMKCAGQFTLPVHGMDISYTRKFRYFLDISWYRIGQNLRHISCDQYIIMTFQVHFLQSGHMTLISGTFSVTRLGGINENITAQDKRHFRHISCTQEIWCVIHISCTQDRWNAFCGNLGHVYVGNISCTFSGCGLHK